MTELIILTVFLCIPIAASIFAEFMSGLYLWQVKEYRFDRVWSHLRFENKIEDNQKLVFLIKLIMLSFLVIFMLQPVAPILLIALPVVFVIYAIALLDVLSLIYKKKLIRPKLKSIRNIIIFLVFWMTLGIGVITLVIVNRELFPSSSFTPVGIEEDFSNLLPNSSRGFVIMPAVTIHTLMLSVLLIIFDLLTPVLLALLSLMTAPLANYVRYRTIDAAKKKLRRMPNLKIIGVTGSYGKTTTKEMLYQILSKKFKTAKTPEHKNTIVGVAQSVISELKTDTEVFVVEMGAYVKGEVLGITRLTPPDVSIVTAVDEQHISLFGSIEKIYEAKYEAIEGLKDNGLAVLNGDNEYCIRMAQRTNKRKLLYFTMGNSKHIAVDIDRSKDQEHEFPVDEHIYAESIKQTNSGLEFNLVKENHKYKVVARVAGIHNVSNLMAAICASLELGLSVKEIAEIINETKFKLAYLNVVDAINQSKLIDDGYNVNEHGFKAGLNYLSSVAGKKKKWIITQGIIELGNSKNRIYQGLAKDIIKYADAIMTNDEDLAKSISSLDSQFEVVMLQSDPASWVEVYKRNIKNGEFVLLEGPLPALVIDGITE